MTTPRFKRLVAELISGTAVPRSLGVLGVAEKARDELCHYLHLFGYPDANEVLKAIDKLEEEHREGHEPR